MATLRSTSSGDADAAWQSTASAAAVDASSHRSDWEVRHDDASGAVYYYNTRTGDASWDAPGDVDANSSDAHVASDGAATLSIDSSSSHLQWTEAFDESGRVYYVNLATLETRWDLPVDSSHALASGSSSSGSGRHGASGDAKRPSTAEQMEKLNRLLSGDDDDEDDDRGDVSSDTPAPALGSGSEVLVLDPPNTELALDLHASLDQAPGADEALEMPWLMFLNESDGVPYYYNHSTGECVWEPPEAFTAFHNQQQQQQLESEGESVDASSPARQSARSAREAESPSARCVPSTGRDAASLAAAPPLITPELEAKVRRAIESVSNTPVGSSRVLFVRSPSDKWPETTSSSDDGAQAASIERPLSSGRTHASLSQSRPGSALSGSASSRPRSAQATIPEATAVAPLETTAPVNGTVVESYDPDTQSFVLVVEPVAEDAFVSAPPSQALDSGSDELESVQSAPSAAALALALRFDEAAVVIACAARCFLARRRVHRRRLERMQQQEQQSVEEMSDAVACEEEDNGKDDETAAAATAMEHDLSEPPLELEQVEPSGSVMLDPETCESDAEATATQEDAVVQDSSEGDGDSASPTSNDLVTRPVTPEMLASHDSKSQAEDDGAPVAATVSSLELQDTAAESALTTEQVDEASSSELPAPEPIADVSSAGPSIDAPLTRPPTPASLVSTEHMESEQPEAVQDQAIQDAAAAGAMVPAPASPIRRDEDGAAGLDAPVVSPRPSAANAPQLPPEPVHNDSSSSRRSPMRAPTPSVSAPSAPVASRPSVQPVTPATATTSAASSVAPRALDIAQFFSSHRQCTTAPPSSQPAAAVDRADAAASVGITRKRVEIPVPKQATSPRTRQAQRDERAHAAKAAALAEHERAARELQELRRLYNASAAAFAQEKHDVLRARDEMRQQRRAETQRGAPSTPLSRDRATGSRTNSIWRSLERHEDAGVFATALAQLLEPEAFVHTMRHERALALAQRVQDLQASAEQIETQLDAIDVCLLAEDDDDLHDRKSFQVKYASKLRRVHAQRLRAQQFYQTQLERFTDDGNDGDVGTVDGDRSAYWRRIDSHYRRAATSQHATQDFVVRVLRDANGDSLLHVAAWRGRVDAVAALLALGADVNAVDTSVSRTRALHVACRGGHLDVVQLLVRAGARLDVVDAAGDSPLHLACRHHWPRVVRFLLTVAAAAELSTTGEEERLGCSLAAFFHMRNGKKRRAVDLVKLPSLLAWLERTSVHVCVISRLSCVMLCCAACLWLMD